MNNQSPTFAAVILAAGMSRRMGSPKALLNLDGSPLIARLVDSVLQNDWISPIVVVTGHQPELIQERLKNQRITFSHNPDFDAGGMFSSVRTGLAAVRGSCDAFFLMLLDQPLVRTQTLQLLSDEWRKHEPSIVTPAHEKRRGHPILLAARCIEPIMALPPQTSLRDFVEREQDRIRVVDVNDAGVSTDVDTPEDYQIILNLWRERSRSTD